MTALASRDLIDRELERACELENQGKVARPRYIGRWVISGILVLYVVQIIVWAVQNPKFRWDIVGDYLFDNKILSGLQVTLELTLICMILGSALGICVALMRMSKNPILRSLSGGYLWLVRGIPTLVQLLFWYFLAAVLPEIPFGLPFLPVFGVAETNAVINQMGAAILGLSIGEAAYMAEIVRAGLLSVPAGQKHAAVALGMKPVAMMYRIVLPQALRVIVPPTGNQVIAMLKWTAAVFVIGLPDLLTQSQIIYGQNFQQIPLLIVTCFWYLLCVSILMFLQSRLERHFGRGYGESSKKVRVVVNVGQDV